MLFRMILEHEARYMFLKKSLLSVTSISRDRASIFISCIRSDTFVKTIKTNRFHRVKLLTNYFFFYYIRISVYYCLLIFGIEFSVAP